jgi:protein SOK2
MTTQGNSYEWTGQSMGSSVQGSQPLSIDTGLSGARSLPTTPATTPPGTNLQSIQQYQSQPSYDSKSYYSAAPSSQPHYAPHQTMSQQNMTRYGQSIITEPYMKNIMAPPSDRTGGLAHSDSSETQANPYSHSQGNGQVAHGTGEVKSDHEHHSEYLNDTNAAYNANRGSYAYTTNAATGNLSGEHPHLSPEITDSTSHQSGSDRVKSQWAADYSAPPRPAPSSNLYNVMSDTRTNGTNGSGGDTYPTSSNTASAYSSINGSSKRLREDDDQDQTSRPESRSGDSGYDHKRRKTLGEPGIGGPVGGPLPLQSVKTGVGPRRR